MLSLRGRDVTAAWEQTPGRVTYSQGKEGQERRRRGFVEDRGGLGIWQKEIYIKNMLYV